MNDNENIQAGHKILCIGEFKFDGCNGSLLKGQEVIRLEPQTSDFLMFLATNQGRIVSREQLLATVWNHRQVTDDAIRAVVRKLRTALGDDARNPHYIKTIPLKGYMLIANVVEGSDHTSHPLKPQNRIKQNVFKASVVLGLLAIYWLFQFQNTPQVKELQTSVAYITQMPGSEVSPDYNPATQMLVFSHRRSNEDPMQLYVKNLATNRIQRLTWDDANYANALWSPNGTQLIYTRSSPSGVEHYLAEFNTVAGLVSNKPLQDDALTGKFIIAWSANNHSIYLKDTYKRNSPQGISRYDLTSKEIVSVTAPSMSGLGDFYARESHDGKSLALLRATDGNKHELLVLDITSGALVLNRVLPFNSNRLIWTQNNRSLILSGFKGELVQYDISSDDFSIIPMTLEHTNDVIYHCGELCFFMRQHNGNYLDIQEQPNPFMTQNILATDYLQLPGADDLPVYSNSGDALYFVSLTADELLVHRQAKQSPLAVLAHLPKDKIITSMQVNNKQTAITGIIGKRIFILNIKDGQLRFITTDFEQVRNPVWDIDGETVLYSKTEQRQNKIYRHYLHDNKREVISKNYVAFRQLNQSKQIAIDPEMKAWLLVEDQEPVLLATLQSANPNRWRVIDGNFYFTWRSGADAILTRVSLSADENDSRVLARNQFRLNFDVHPAGDRIAIVKSVLAESNIIKINGPIRPEERSQQGLSH